MEDMGHSIGLRRNLNYVRPWRAEVDALGIFPEKLVLVEGKVQRLVDGISKLGTYEMLIQDTPELQRYKDKPVEKVLVCPWNTQQLARTAGKLGVAIDVYQPQWIIDYVASLQSYWTAGARRRREEVFALREQFGLE